MPAILATMQGIDSRNAAYSYQHQFLSTAQKLMTQKTRPRAGARTQQSISSIAWQIRVAARSSSNKPQIYAAMNRTHSTSNVMMSSTSAFSVVTLSEGF